MFQCEVGLSEHGLLEGSGGHSTSWVRHVRVASDCHSVNIIVHLLPEQSAVTLTTVRTVHQGEEFRLWFDHDTLAAAGIPFLAPNNIQGKLHRIALSTLKIYEISRLSVFCSLFLKDKRTSMASH